MTSKLAKFPVKIIELFIQKNFTITSHFQSEKLPGKTVQFLRGQKQISHCSLCFSFFFSPRFWIIQPKHSTLLFSTQKWQTERYSCICIRAVRVLRVDGCQLFPIYILIRAPPIARKHTRAKLMRT